MNSLISGYSSIESLATFKEEFESIISEAKSVSTMPPLTKCLGVLPLEKPCISKKRKSSSVTSDDSITTKHKLFKPSPQVQSTILGDVTNKQSTSTKRKFSPLQSNCPTPKRAIKTKSAMSIYPLPQKMSDTKPSPKKMGASSNRSRFDYSCHDYFAQQEAMGFTSYNSPLRDSENDEPCQNNSKATSVAYAGPESRAIMEAQQAQVNQEKLARTSKVAVEQNDLDFGVSNEEPDLVFGASDNAETAAPAMDDAVGDETDATIEVNDETAANTAKKCQPVVKFGTNSAVSFDKLQPITELTPMPPHVVEELFPSDGKKETAEEHVSRETKQNVAILAEWDPLFDESEQSTKRKRGRKCTPCKSKNTKRPSNSRRDSAFFSKEQFDLDFGVSNEEPDLDFGVSNDDASNDVEAEPTAAAAEVDFGGTDNVKVAEAMADGETATPAVDSSNDVEAEPTPAAAEVDFGGTDNVEAAEETAGVEAAVEVEAPPVVQPRVRVRVPRRAVRRVRMIRVSIMIYCITYQRSFVCTHLPTHSF
jgi:hypothetical protein